MYFFRGHLLVGPILALLRTCANGSNDSVFPLHSPMFLHGAAGTPAPKQPVGNVKEQLKDAVLVTLS